ncbi:hypothetical protein PybrP1_012091 [[Pythium] brassicae (nom. inval.)]|nr:hypothetical protein PybrP1_012091 [[Pythium] brassicae (nom. inval.)]
MGEKRKGGWKGGDDRDGAKRYKGALAFAAAAKGSGGVLVTCDKTKERQSVRDTLDVLNDAADKFFPATEMARLAGDAEETDSGATAAASSAADTVQKKLQDEINALRADAKKRKTGRFTALDTGVKGVILIQILDPEISARALVLRIFAEVEASKEFASRFISRLIPLEKIGHAARDDIRELARPMIAAQLAAHRSVHGADAPPLEYAVDIKRRNCTHIKSMEVINDLAAVVGPEQKVNLTAPEVVILVEVFRNTCGVSVVTNFHEYKKFNVRSILDPPVKGEKPSATAAAADGAEKTAEHESEDASADTADGDSAGKKDDAE